MGAAQAGGFYETRFSFLLRRLDRGARRDHPRDPCGRLSAFDLRLPLGAWAGDAPGWRGAILSLAGVQALITLPANILGVRFLRRGERRGPDMAAVRPGGVCTRCGGRSSGRLPPSSG